jgi:hypothetical protein
VKPHPSFADWHIPKEHILGAFKLNALSIKDLDRDYEAVMASAAEIKTANANSLWPPDDLTREDNMIDLAWHQKEFAARRSFAWAVEDDSGSYLGCAYVHPSIAGENAADVAWWWKTGVDVDRKEFRHQFLGWLAGNDWPSLEYRPTDMW